MLKSKQTLLIIVLVISLIINLSLIVSTHFSWNTLMQKYLPLQSEIKDLKSDLSQAHLWFEEAISGDKYVDIENDVMEPLKHKTFHHYVMHAEKIFTNKEDITYVIELQHIDNQLNKFYITAQKRWADSKQFGIGSVLDQKFDKDFIKIITSIDILTARIEKNMSTEIEAKDRYFELIISFFLFINFAVLFILFLSKKEQRRYEHSLFEEKEKAIVTLRSIGDAVVITDINGNITFLNEIAEKLTEKVNSEVYGMHIDEVLELWNMKTNQKIKTPIDDVLHHNLTKLISNGTKLISKSGKEYIISDSAAPVKDNNGIIIGTVLVFQDDTQKHIEAEKLQATHILNEKLQERMELALLGTQDGIWDWNILNDKVYLSPRWKEIIGFNDDELPSLFSSWKERVHPDDLEAAMKGLQENIDKKTEYHEGVHRLKHKDGHWVWILDRGKAFFDENGKATRMIGTHTDVSQNKELELRSLERGKILDNSTNEIFIFDSTTYKFLYINKGAQENIGYSLEEMLELTPVDIKPEIDEEGFIELLQPILEDGKENIHFSTVHQRKDKSKYDVDIYLQTTIYEGHDAYVAFILDVTARKKIEKESAGQYALMENIIDTVPVRIFWKDNNLIYIGANKLFLQDAGLNSIQDIIGKDDFNLPWTRTEAKAYRADDLHVMESGIPKVNIEEVQTHEDGSITTLLTSKVPLLNEGKDVIGVLGSYADITKQRETEDELTKQKEVLAHQAHHDALTELPNRVLFNDRLKQAIEKAKRNDTKIALLFIDLDHFKEINDSLGHEVGDKILKIVTSRLKQTVRDEDTISRLGGDEFTVIIEDLKQGQDASFLAQKLLYILEEPIKIDTHTLYVSSSIGISIYPDDGVSSANLLKYADSAMYKAKDEGRNNFQFYSVEMTELAFERVLMETSLREALQNKDFVVHYQPQVNGLDNRLIGMEALVRWNHKNMGLISPAKFIPIAESTGLIVELDRFVMRTAMTQVATWYREGLNPGILAMNLSIKQLQQKDFISMLKNLIKETGCKEQWIELELTEGQIMTHPQESIQILNQISDIGIELAIDDFGTGYSSLSYLKKLPIHKLKIDQSFVKNLPDDKEDAAITKAVIALAKSLNLKIIAEGVETKEQKEFMVNNDCNNIQGYFYSKPVPMDKMQLLLSNGLNIH